MKVDPTNYLEMDRQTLAKALEASPKIIRTVKCNKSLVLLKPEYALKTLKYSEIGLEEINKRIKILDDNPQFIELISSILSDKAQQKMSMDQTEPLHEDTIYSGGFANEKDKALMKKFHQVSEDKKKNTETGSEKNTESSVESTDELQATEGDNLIVPLEAWQTVLNQLGNLHEANQLMADARERAAKAEAEAEFLREKLKNTREQLDTASKKKRFFFF